MGVQPTQMAACDLMSNLIITRSLRRCKVLATLMQVFHWSRPCNRPYDARFGCKRSESVMTSPTGRFTYRQDVMAFPRRCRVGDVYCMASRRSATTSPKPLTDKPYQVPTSHTDKQAGLEKHTGPHDQTCSWYCQYSF